MELSAYLTFVVVSAVQIATPGPSTLFIVNNAVVHRWRRALGALSGDLVAIALLATLSVIGLGALLEACPAAFLALRLAGAVYIIWLGWTFLRPASPQSGRSALAAADSRGSGELWLHSFGVGISNPKAVLFFAALFPQFLPSESGPAVLALLFSTFVAVKFVIVAGYAIGARHAVRLLRKHEHEIVEICFVGATGARRTVMLADRRCHPKRSGTGNTEPEPTRSCFRPTDTSSTSPIWRGPARKTSNST